MDLYNIKVEKKTQKLIEAIFEESELIKGIPIIQWVPEGNNVQISLNVPDLIYKNEEFNPDSLKILKGVGESACKELKEGEIVQFLRIGFCKINKSDSEKIIASFAHN